MRRIPLRDRAGGVRAYALVDDDDFEWLNQWRWHLDGAGYARRSVHNPRRAIFMHRLVMGEPSCKVDHWDGNTTNNQRDNLRLATSQQNQQHKVKLDKRNTTGARGVVRHRDKFQVRVQIDGVQRAFGRYDTVEEAAVVARAVREEHYGEFAGLA